MHFVALSLALCAVVQAAPVPNLSGITIELTGKEDWIVRDFVPVIRDLEKSRNSEREDVDFDLWYKDPSKLIKLEENPVLEEIFQHVEDIIQSKVSAKSKIKLAVDAIVHHEESKAKESRVEHSTSSEETLAEINKILSHENDSSDEKVRQILYEIVQQYKHGQAVEAQVQNDSDALDEAVFRRIRFVIYGPESPQKRMQMIMNLLAEHLHPKHSLGMYREGDVDNLVKGQTVLDWILTPNGGGQR